MQRYLSSRKILWEWPQLFFYLERNTEMDFTQFIYDFTFKL